jgi:hypothetical protein
VVVDDELDEVVVSGARAESASSTAAAGAVVDALDVLAPVVVEADSITV